MRRALFSTFFAASDVLATTDCDNLQTAISGLQCEEKRTCSEGFTCNIHPDTCDYTCEAECPSVILIGNSSPGEDLPGRQATSVLGEVCQSSAFDDRRNDLEHYKCSMSDDGLIVSVTVPDVVRLYDWDKRLITLIPQSIAEKQDPQNPTTVFDSMNANENTACTGVPSNGFVHFNVSQSANCRFDKSEFSNEGMHLYKFTVGYDDLVDDTNPLADGTFPVIKYGRQWDLSCTLDALGSDAVEVSASGDRQLDLMEDTEEVDFDLEVFGASDFKTPFTTKNIDPMVEEIPYAYFKASAFIKNEFPEQETDHFLHIKRCNAELIDDEGKMLQTRRLLFKGCKDNDVFADRNVLQYDRVLMDAYSSDYFRLHLWKPHGYGEYEFAVTCHMSVCTMADVLAGNRHCVDNCNRYDDFKSVIGRKRRSTDEYRIPQHEVSKTIRIKFIEHESSPKIIKIADDTELPDIEVLDNQNRFVPLESFNNEPATESSGEKLIPEVTLKIAPEIKADADSEHRYPTEYERPTTPKNNFQFNNRNIALISIGIICMNAFAIIFIMTKCKQN